MKSSRISLAAGAAAGAAVLLAAGCGSTGSTGSTAAATSPKTATLTATQAVHLAASQSQTETSLTGTFTEVMRGSVTMNASGTVAARSKPSLFADVNMSTLTASGQTIPGGMEEILTPTTIYMRMSELQKMLGKQWIELPYSELSGATGGLNLGQFIQQAQGNNPTTQTQFLAGANNVRTVGTSVIDGVPVTEYTGTIPMTKALSHIPASARAQARQLLQDAGITTANFNVWIDDQHHVRKLILIEPGSKSTVTLTLQITSINQPISTEVPPASETATVPASSL